MGVNSVLGRLGNIEIYVVLIRILNKEIITLEDLLNLLLPELEGLVGFRFW